MYDPGSSTEMSHSTTTTRVLDALRLRLYGIPCCSIITYTISVVEARFTMLFASCNPFSYEVNYIAYYVIVEHYSVLSFSILQAF